MTTLRGTTKDGHGNVFARTEQAYEDGHRTASTDVDKCTQAMWDARAILGFDNDGDETPAACITPMGGGLDGYIARFLADMREAREDYDAALEEIPA